MKLNEDLPQVKIELEEEAMADSLSRRLDDNLPVSAMAPAFAYLKAQLESHIRECNLRYKQLENNVNNGFNRVDDTLRLINTTMASTVKSLGEVNKDMAIKEALSSSWLGTSKWLVGGLGAMLLVILTFFLSHVKWSWN